MDLTAIEAVYTASQAQRAPTLTQSAAVMVAGSNKRYSTLSRSLDALLDGGIQRGSVLEISGPPGSAKEFLAENITRGFVEEGEEVLFVGTVFRYLDRSSH